MRVVAIVQAGTRHRTQPDHWRAYELAVVVDLRWLA